MSLFAKDFDNIRDGFGKAVGAGLAASVFSVFVFTYQTVTAPRTSDPADLGYYGTSASGGYVDISGDNGGYIDTRGPRGQTR